jgi:hypothetical protein
VALNLVARFLRATGQPVSAGTVHAGAPGGTDLAAIAALAAGAALIACCWALSLRARPPGSRLTSSVNP